MLSQLSKQSFGLSRRLLSTTVRSMNPNLQLTQEQIDQHYPKIGNREIVGYGFNGNANYIDLTEFPAPAVRWAPNTEAVLALREREKCDWKTLTMEEKKALYRASFRHTYAEMKAPTGEWKCVVALLFGCFSAAGWFMVWLKTFVYPPLPHTINEEWKKEELQKMLIQNQGPIEGVSSKYDFDNKRWK